MCIKVWPFSEAPDTYRQMSTNGGDEDWVALVPLEWKDRYYIGWLEAGMSPCFGCCCIDWYEHRDGWVVIGAHS